VIIKSFCSEYRYAVCASTKKYTVTARGKGGTGALAAAKYT